jgi:hypothetical protein
MKRVRITHPVMGMIVTAMIGMGYLGASPATRAASRRDTIRPGDRVGPIVLGMTEAELAAAMGEATDVPRNDPLNVRRYAARGVAVYLSMREPRTVAGILAGRVEGVIHPEIIGPLAWRTADGVGVGSSAGEITAVYGRPDAEQRVDAKENWHLMIYNHLGIHFGLRDGQVKWIAVKQPLQA